MNTGRTEIGVEGGRASEQHATPSQIAALWGLSEKAVIRLFEGEPGVLNLDRPESRYKRGYRTFRIPASVAERVHRRLEVK
jgi:hypothetical protein